MTAGEIYFPLLAALNKAYDNLAEQGKATESAAEVIYHNLRYFAANSSDECLNRLNQLIKAGSR